MACGRFLLAQVAGGRRSVFDRLHYVSSLCGEEGVESTWARSLLARRLALYSTMSPQVAQTVSEVAAENVDGAFLLASTAAFLAPGSHGQVLA